MRRWIALAAALYPRSWREQYAREFEALLDDVRPSGQVLMNVLGGAIRIQMKSQANWLKLIAATTVLGAIVAGGASFAVSPSYVSSAVVGITPQADPLRPVPPQVLRQRVADNFVRSRSNVLSRRGLSILINDPSLDLYRAERMRLPLDEVENIMRRDIKMQTRPSTGDGPLVISVSFAYPDRVKAQATVHALATRLTQETARGNRDREISYRFFWQDMAAIHRATRTPPPPVGEIAGILVPASLPTEGVRPSRWRFAGWGLAAGLIFGLLTMSAIRHPRLTWKLGAFAGSGCLLAIAASFLIPERYTATASMQIVSAALTEDPLSVAPPSSAAQTLRQLEPVVLSVDRLSKLIADPRLNLYSGERSSRPTEEVVGNMLAHDLRIAIANTPGGGAGSVFTISFTSHDRRTSVETVNAMISAFIQTSTVQARDRVEPRNVIQRDIFSRRSGEYLDVLDPPTTPLLPDSPHRSVIAGAGLGMGLVIGAIVLRRRRPEAAEPQAFGCALS